MNINDKMMGSEISKQIHQSTKNVTEQTEKQPSVAEKNVERTDQSGQDTIVNLSPALKEAQATKEIVASEPDIREDKVAEIKTKIKSGEYNVDHQAVADKLVDYFLDEIF